MVHLENGGRDLGRIHAISNDKKYYCHLTGFLEGVVSSGYLESGEFEPLLVKCREFLNRIGDPDADDILQDFEADLLEYEMIVQCAESRAEEIDQTCEKSGLNRFLGFCRGIACDGVITALEADAIVRRVETQEYLLAVPGVREIYQTALDAIEDRVVDREESAEIARAITAIVGDSYADTGLSTAFGVAVYEEHRLGKISEEIEARVVVLTGIFKTSPRSKLEDRLSEMGAIIGKNVTGKTEYLIIGGEASRDWIEMNRGTKVRKAQELRNLSKLPLFVSESQLLRLLKN